MTTPRLADRYRQLRTDPAARRTLYARAATLAAVRTTLTRAGHIEIDTPLLQRARRFHPGRSFRTHPHHLPPTTYLRSSTLHLRGMLTAGVERVYEVGRRFRDEPSDATHLPEHTLVEIYRAHATYEDMAELVRELFVAAALAALGTTRLKVADGTGIDLADDPEHLSIHQALSCATGTEVTPGTDLDHLRDLADAHDVTLGPQASADLALLDLYEHLAEPHLMAPTLVTGFPAGQSPLAKAHPDDDRLAQKWDLVIGGVEMATSYTELVDPAELAARLTPPTDGSPPPIEAAGLDEDFVEVFASSHTTMPPAAGLCIGADRLVQLLTGAPTVHDALPFGGAW
ncbi:hypothetical protein KIK06_24915 [Nocardiopsis sp. EMB25]|uniref:amino acid--tRNA ligase-related protein n=1 Tax=Nocardiopsis sp. EMB25 TaxID=2835867 RepID=UPI002284C459|nr:amino acid--tRNA ligase-related protein [Nocardiopsis sp. EMB25]MCY9787131.1 hypothetical protein [Nocardiopsis sp. EMB25]